MSTRAYLMIKNGAEVRYCFTHWDGYNHGEELLRLSQDEIKAIWDKLGNTSKAWYFDSFMSEPSRKQTIDYYKEQVAKDPDSSVYKESLARYKKYKPIPELAGEEPDASTSGIFQLENGKLPDNADKLPPMTGDAFIFIEFVWVYDMKTGKIYYYTCWQPERLNKKKFAVKYKRHLYSSENFCGD